MPLYEYECRKCHHRFELIEKFDAPEHRKCPKCGARADRRIARSAIQFKGSGWYVTDYAGKSGSSGSSSENSDKGSKSEESGKSEKKETKETKTEKPAAKESSKPAKKS